MERAKGHYPHWLLVVVMVLFAPAAVLGQSPQSQSPAANPEPPETLKGLVSDGMCRAKHILNNKTAAECARACAKIGYDYALIVGKKTYLLKGDNAEIGKLAGERVTVKGIIADHTVTVQSIGPSRRVK